MTSVVVGATCSAFPLSDNYDEFELTDFIYTCKSL